MDTRLPEGFRVDGGHQEVNNHGMGTTSIVVVAIIAGLALGSALYSQWKASNAEREARMLEYYVMELDGKLMAMGVVKPPESWSAQKRKREEETEK
jgi:hypothetical protein